MEMVEHKCVNIHNQSVNMYYNIYINNVCVLTYINQKDILYIIYKIKKNVQSTQHIFSYVLSSCSLLLIFLRRFVYKTMVFILDQISI